MKIKIIWIIVFVVGLAVRSTGLFHPTDTTSWRESDISSIARNYYRNGMNFFYPQIDWGGTGPGYTESEFPVYPYLIAISYKIFGVWEPAGRIISLLFSLGTLLIFFRLCKYLFNPWRAIAASFFFALSPLLMFTSVSIQPEPLMFFFYVLSVDSFMHWIDNQSVRTYILTFVFTALALLCKITAINIGILFLIMIITRKGWKYLFKPNVLFLGALSIIPSILWYYHSHQFYLKYGNSLGLSNEYAWIGWDFFTNPYFIKGIIKQEIMHIWTFVGPFILLLAIVSTRITRDKHILLPVCWLASSGFFYIISSRTTADDWAYYYHIFSVPGASMLLGISVAELLEKYLPIRQFNFNSRGQLKDILITSATIILISFYIIFSFKYLMVVKPMSFKTADFYICKKDLSDRIPEGALILASGGPKKDRDEYNVAFNNSYLFYWLDRKGYNIPIEDQTVENILKFKEMGVKYYVAEIAIMNKKAGFEKEMRQMFKVELECNGVILFRL